MPDLHYSEQPVYSQHAIAGDYYHYELPLQAQLQNRPPPPADAPTPESLQMLSINQLQRNLWLQLNTDAQDFFSQPQPLPPSPSLRSYPAENATLGQALQETFSQTTGLVITEPRPAIFGRQLLRQCMQQLHDSGVKTLYLDLLCSDRDQDALDRFASSGEAQMDPVLRARLQRLDQQLVAGSELVLGEDLTLFQLLTLAREHAIKVIAIDCQASYDQPAHYLAFTYFAKKVIQYQQSLDGAGKFLVLTSRVANHHAESIAPGLPELTGSLVMRSSVPQLAPPLFILPGQSGGLFNRERRRSYLLAAHGSVCRPTLLAAGHAEYQGENHPVYQEKK